MLLTARKSAPIFTYLFRMGYGISLLQRIQKSKRLLVCEEPNIIGSLHFGKYSSLAGVLIQDIYLVKWMSVSSFVRWAIFSKQTQVSVNEDVFTEGMKELRMANGRAAGNLNQIAKNLNSGVSVDKGILQAIRTAVSEIIAFNRKLEKMYREHYGNSKTHFEQEC